jgi:secondary thiamine-phosphate synthase enzyme
MAVASYTFHVGTKGLNDVHDLTPTVVDYLSKSTLRDGIATIFVPGSTAGVTTIEFESGAINDLRKAIDRLAPRDLHYDHDARWGDGNGFAHVRAALLGPSLSVPFSGGELLLGTWQQIILIDFDNRPRTREVRVQIVGEY